MTIAVTIKVNDGIVLASDSATTFSSVGDDGQQVIHAIYNHQNKVFNLVKGLPIGAITFGMGSIGHSSISTLSKDMRKLFSNEHNKTYGINPNTYTMEEVAEKVRLFFEEKLAAAHPDGDRRKGVLGYWVIGYSEGKELSEVWNVSFVDGHCKQAVRSRAEDECGVDWSGEPEAISRLILGRSDHMADVLGKIGMREQNIAPAMHTISQHLMAPVLQNAMPIQDAVDLADFLVDLTIRFSKFTPGGATVGGPIEIAAITKHEGFKWVKRKHYFDKGLNAGADYDRPS